MELIIGTKAWSTWSLRPWLALKHTGAPFAETIVPLRREDTPALIAVYSPSGKVPVLKDGGVTVWDSLAICEYLHERFPQARLWPDDAEARARGRAAAAEMHSGFMALRNECPMDLVAEPRVAELSEATLKDVRRILDLWADLRTRHGAGGPFMLGAWSIADAFFTPVATRLRTYGVALPPEAAAYVAAVLSTPEFLAWEQDA